MVLWCFYIQYCVDIKNKPSSLVLSGCCGSLRSRNSTTQTAESHVSSLLANPKKPAAICSRPHSLWEVETFLLGSQWAGPIPAVDSPRQMQQCQLVGSHSGLILFRWALISAWLVHRPNLMVWSRQSKDLHALCSTGWGISLTTACAAGADTHYNIRWAHVCTWQKC